MPFLNFSLLINEIELIKHSPMEHSLLEVVGRITLQNWTMHLAQAQHLTSTERRAGDGDEGSVS